MNRQLMNRQMFKMGGAAFPDLSGDGKVTQKDILIGRGVIEKQEGGMVPETPMMMEETMVAAPEPAMMPQQGQADPEVLGAVFDQLQGQVDNIEGSDDLEEMMNAVRGDVQPVEARRAELAEFVGPEDAQQTPDSVLALVQPVMQLASIDQGIGSLAADEMMDTPVEGPMAEGIMSTVNMAPDMPAEAPMMEVGSPPPVNFNQGGAVRAFANGGSPAVPSLVELGQQQLLAGPTVNPIDLAAGTEEAVGLIRQYAGERPDQTENLRRQEELAKSQMLFDIANTALAFATPGSRQMSPAERLAEAAQETQLLDKIGARSQGILEAQRAEELAAYEDRRETALAGFGAAAEAAQQQRGIQAQAVESQLGRDFTQGENETDRDFRKRMLKLQGALNIELQEAIGAEDRKGARTRADLNERKAKLDNVLAKSLMADRYKYEGELQTSAQQHARDILDRKGEIDAFLQEARFDRIDGGYAIQSDLQKERMQLDADLGEIRARADFNRDLEKIDVIQDDRLELLGKEYKLKTKYRTNELEQLLKNNKELTKYNARFAQKSQEKSFQHQAEQAALDRAAAMDRQISDQEFQKLVREEAQNFTSDQNMLDRIVASYRADLESGQRNRQLDISQGTLDLAPARQFFDSQIAGYNAYTARIGALQQQVGSTAKTATLNYLTGNMQALADGTLDPQQQALYEQVLLDYVSPKFDPINNTYSSPQLTQSLLDAVAKRDEREGNTLLKQTAERPIPGTRFEMQEGGLVPREITSQFVQASPFAMGMMDAGDRLKVRDQPAQDDPNIQNPLEKFSTPPLTAAQVRSPEFNVSLLKTDGSVNLDSPSWRAVPTTIFDPEVKYEVATGLGGGGTRLSNYFVETFRELIGGEGLSEEGAELVQADRDLIGLKNKLLMEITNFADDRVLKFVQEELAKDVEGLTPGLFKSDEKALATLNTLSKTLGTAFNSVVKGLPEYGGDPSLFRPAEVTKYRARAETLKGLIAETLSFKDAYESYLSGLGGTLREDQRKAAREFLKNLGQK